MIRGALVITRPPPPCRRSLLLAGRRAARPRRPGRQAHGALDPVQCPVCRHAVAETASAQVRDQGVEPLGVERAEEAVVHLHARGVVAARQALGLLKGELAVGCRLTDGDPQRGLRVVEDLVGAGEHAGDVRANGDHVAAHRLGVEHVVEVAVPRTSAGVQPRRSAMSSIASSLSQPSCAWARWHNGTRAERRCG